MNSHYMSICGAYIKLSVALVLTSIGLFTSSASGQSPATRPNTTDKEIAAAHASRLGNPEDKVAISEPKSAGEDNKDVAKKPKSKDLRAKSKPSKQRTPRFENCFARWRSNRRRYLNRSIVCSDALMAAGAELSIDQPIVPPTRLMLRCR